MMNITKLTKLYIVSRARPELVEGFLRALGDILRQAQDEREKIFFENNLMNVAICM